MATYQAIAAVSESVVRLLRGAYDPALFDGNELEFQVYGPQDFVSPMSAGVSLYVYRVLPHGTHRTPPGRPGPSGKPGPPRLPLEVHMLLTVWAGKASLQNAVAGWMMRTLEDTPTLPAALLNATWAEVFRPDEAVEVVPAELSTEDLMQMWDVLTETGYRLSVPYQARVIHIDSLAESDGAPPVHERSVGLGKVEGAG